MTEWLMGNRFSVRAETVQGVVRADKIGNLTQNFGKSPGDERIRLM